MAKTKVKKIKKVKRSAPDVSAAKPDVMPPKGFAALYGAKVK